MISVSSYLMLSACNGNKFNNRYYIIIKFTFPKNIIFSYCFFSIVWDWLI